MKILFINPGGRARGGAELSLAELIRGLVDRGHEVEVALMATGDASTLFRDCGARIVAVVADELQVAPRHASSARFVHGAVKALPQIGSIVRNLQRVIASSEPDILHSNGFRSHLLTPLLAPGAPPIVWSLRDLAPHRLHRMLLRASSMRAAAVIANSEFTAAQSTHPLVHVVANAVTAIPKRDRRQARRRLGLPADRHVVSVLAHLHPSKGHDVMLAALAHWDAPSRPILAIAGGHHYPGSFEYEKRLLSMADKLGVSEDLRLLGTVEDVADVYAASDVVVHPCRHPEGFGRVVVEANSAGVPVVATDIGGVASLIRHDETGLLVQPDDAVALYKAVDSVMWPGQTRTRLSALGRDAATRFGRDVHVDAVESIYADLLGKTDLLDTTDLLDNADLLDKYANLAATARPEVAPAQDQLIDSSG